MGKRRKSRIEDAAAQGIAQPLKPGQKILMDAAKRASDEASKKGDALRNTGGIVSQSWYYDEQNSDFNFPYIFAETAEKMSRDPFLHKALKSRQSKLEMSKWWFGFKTAELEDSPQHRFVLDYLGEQIDRCGGIGRFIKQQVLPALKYGVSLFAPTFELETRMYGAEQLTLTRFKNMYWYHPGYMFRVFMDKSDLTRVGNVQYWLPDKATVSFDAKRGQKNSLAEKVAKDLTSGEKTKWEKGDEVARSLSMGGGLTLTNIELPMRMGGIVSYNAEGSNPIGRPYTYPLYGIHLATEAIINSTARLFYGTGAHSYQAVPINPDAALLGDPAGIIQQINDTWAKVQSEGGGLVSLTTHKIEPISINEVKDIPAMLDTLFQLSSRTIGESVEALGMDGGSRSLSSAMLKIQQPELVLDAEQLCFDVNNTFIKYFVDMNFGHWIKSGFLQEYPLLKWDIGAVEEILDNAETKDINIQTPPEVRASSILSGENAEGETTVSIIDNGIVQKKRYIKRDPTAGIETITLDIEAMERAYAGAEDNIRAAIKKLIGQKISPILAEGGDLKAVKKAVERLSKDIKTMLEDALRGSAQSFIDLSAQAYLRTAARMEKSIDIDRMAKKALRDAEASLGDKASVAASGLISEIINDISQFYNRNIALGDREIANLALDAFGKDGSYDYVNFAKDIVMYDADIADKSLVDALSKGGAQVAVIRTAIMEGSCEHCKSRDGLIFYVNDRGEYWNPDGYEYTPLPDRNCAGMIHGKGTCRCEDVPVYTGLVRFFKPL